ncbi:MAG: geranylgeranylglycerol-phosphate geranylgeranyltransferase [Promethearchaeia archaeon]
MNFKDAVEITRPINGLMGSLTVFIGILNTRTGVSSINLVLNIILGILTYFFLSGAGMVINDIYDLEIDKINRPERPIPRGSISLSQAKQLYVILLCIGLSLSFLHMILLELHPVVFIIAVIFAFIGWLYAVWGKKQGFLGNIIVSVSYSIGLIYGALLNSEMPIYIYLFFLTSFSLLMAREIIKGCEDIKGDTEEGVKTLAITLGINKAVILGVLFQILAILFFIFPLFTSIINPVLFLIFMFLGLVVVGYALLLSFNHNQQKDRFSKISLLLKVGALFGLLAFLFASI